VSRRRPGAVMHLKADWLPASEVFVYDLVRSMTRPSVVVGVNRLENTERFPVPSLLCLSWVERFVRPASIRPLVFSAAVGHLIERHEVSLVHVHHGYRVETVVAAVRRKNVPLVLSLHGHDVTGYLAHRPDPYRDVAGSVSAVVVPSAFLVDHAAAAGFDRSVIRVLPSGVDTSLFCASPLPEDERTVVFVGRFVEKKGLDVLARAWPSVRLAVPDARLLVLGYGPLEPVARTIEGVEVTLAPGPTQVRDAMRRARVVVSPSRVAPDDSFESLLMVNLEAQASGRPVVTTRHGGIPEYVRDGETALVVPENDDDALADAIVRVLEDDSLAARMSVAGPSWASRFDLRRTTRAVEDLYDELLGSSPSGQLSAASGSTVAGPSADDDDRAPLTGRRTLAGTPEAR
jgi:glycosyltransferase involved in cell wall biosynthesis